ncbi:hypothetical protein CFP56_044089 [Quercus suber]|uniref:Uncharacterized protein n=1 Tax=Quercus suber TaxID=58331 RepID=A0AAW0IQ12_QUESU
MAAGEIEDHWIQRTASHKAACIGRNKWFVYVKGLILDKLSSKTPQVIQGGAPLDSYMACLLYG